MDVALVTKAALPNLTNPPQPKNLGQELAARLATNLKRNPDASTITTTVNEFFTEKDIRLTSKEMLQFSQGLEISLLGTFFHDPLSSLPIKKKIFPNLEHGNLQKVVGIVLHQTDSSSAKATLRAYKTQKTGAHFLIDKDGTIYLTANLDKATYHVGKIRPRCDIEKKCSKTEQAGIDKIGFKPKTLHRREQKKAYPARYPTNKDSIGIEVVGKFNEKKKSYGGTTKDQKRALDNLVAALKEKYSLTDSDIYRHGVISYKKTSEARYLGY